MAEKRSQVDEKYTSPLDAPEHSHDVTASMTSVGVALDLVR